MKRKLLVVRLAEMIAKGLHDVRIETSDKEVLKVAKYIIENGEVELGYDKENKTPTASIKFRFD